MTTSFGWSERIQLLNNALEGKTHAEVMTRSRFLVRSWKPAFVVVDEAVMVFDEKADFVDYLYNPYIQDVKESLVKKVTIDTDMTCSPIMTKGYNGVLVSYIKLFHRGKLVAKLGGQAQHLNNIREAINQHVNHLLNVRG